MKLGRNFARFCMGTDLWTQFTTSKSMPTKNLAISPNRESNFLLSSVAGFFMRIIFDWLMAVQRSRFLLRADRQYIIQKRPDLTYFKSAKSGQFNGQHLTWSRHHQNPFDGMTLGVAAAAHILESWLGSEKGPCEKKRARYWHLQVYLLDIARHRPLHCSCA